MKTIDELWLDVIEAQGITAKDKSKPAVRFIQANGLKFRVLDWGGSGQPILFFHGGGQDSYTWEMVCMTMRERGYHCIGMDMRNHGGSDKVELKGPMLDPRDMATDIGPAIQALGLNKPVVVAHSISGLAALYWIAKHPAEYKSLVCVDITPTPGRASRAQNFAYMAKTEWDTWEQALDDAVKANPYRPRVQLEFGLRHSLEQREDGKWARRRSRVPAGAAPRKRTPEEEKEFMNPTTPPYADLFPQITNITCPVLVAYGLNSDTTNKEVVDKFLTQLPNGRAVPIAMATHTVQGDKPKPLADAITKFLEQTA